MRYHTNLLKWTIDDILIARNRDGRSWDWNKLFSDENDYEHMRILTGLGSNLSPKSKMIAYQLVRANKGHAPTNQNSKLPSGFCGQSRQP